MRFYELIQDKRNMLLSLLPFAILLAWFEYLEKTIVAKYYMHSILDAQIPFVKEFVIPYLFWYVYIFIGFTYLAFVSKKDFYKLYLFLFLGMSIAYTIYMIFPNAEALRPAIKDNDIFSILIKGIYHADTPTNVCPSIHVLNTIGVHLALVNCDNLKDKHLIKFASLISAILISVSTVFIKQHSIIDVIAAAILSTVLYLVVYQVPKFITHNYSVYNYEKPM